MKVLNQFATLFGVCLGGVFLSRLFPFPVPASVMSMLLMFCLLMCGLISLENMKEVTDFFLSHMAFFFIPVGVAILEHVDALRNDLPVLALIVVLSTVITFLATAFVVWGARRLQTTLSKRAG